MGATGFEPVASSMR